MGALALAGELVAVPAQPVVRLAVEPAAVTAEAGLGSAHPHWEIAEV